MKRYPLSLLVVCAILAGQTACSSRDQDAPEEMDDSNKDMIIYDML